MIGKIPNMRIAPKKGYGYWTVMDWSSLNLGKGDDFGNEKDWETAIQIFEDRIKGRFIDAIEILKNEDDNSKTRRFGFAIMSLICLLIETLAQFYEGESSSQGISKGVYTNFLSFKSLVLKNLFEDHNDAVRFYETVRCGLLHHAETDDTSLIRYKNPNKPDLPFERYKTGLIVYWSPFYDLLKQELEAYTSKLKDPQNSDDLSLRKNFRKKMNHICGLES
ncbi:hypothetical protein [Thermanaerothrix sp.]|uniref:hypothetical protein n=1 Tax=Thermanaerothrix sp. TaxID=2972675 RepID=UPI002ADDF197|nr:hypothetical protein [Thermanaerothrix sp.]